MNRSLNPIMQSAKSTNNKKLPIQQDARSYRIKTV